MLLNMITQFSTKMVIAVIFQLCIYNTAYLQLEFYLLPKYNQGMLVLQSGSTFYLNGLYHWKGGFGTGDCHLAGFSVA